MPLSFLRFLESMTIAMEADDITTQTANEVRSALGGEEPSTRSELDDRGEVEDLNKVDDIFGTETPDDGPSGNPEQDKQEGAEDLPQMDEPNPEENPDMDDIHGEENPEEGMPLEESPEDAPNEDLAFTKKNRIRDNLVQLYTIVSGDIEIIVNSLASINDKNTIDVINVVLNHMRNCKDYIYKTLTQNLASLEYDELLQRYITLKRVYMICIQMMEKHFKKDEKK